MIAIKTAIFIIGMSIACTEPVPHEVLDPSLYLIPHPPLSDTKSELDDRNNIWLGPMSSSKETKYIRDEIPEDESPVEIIAVLEGDDPVKNDVVKKDGGENKHTRDANDLNEVEKSVNEEEIEDAMETADTLWGNFGFGRYGNVPASYASGGYLGIPTRIYTSGSQGRFPNWGGGWGNGRWGHYGTGR